MSDTSSEPNYQDILNKYAAEINQNPPEPEPTPESIASLPQPEPQAQLIESQPEPQSEPITPPLPETVSEPVVPPQPEPITPPPAPPAPPVIPPSDDLYTPLTSEPVTDKSNSFFKVLFFISLFLFLGVVTAVVYSFINSQKPLSNNQNTPITGSSPTISASTCKINEQEYGVGESFAATDGCNTCTCHPDLTISCTEKACDTTPTTSATTSAAKTLKTYKSEKYGFSFQYSSQAKIYGDLNSQVFSLNIDSKVVSLAISSNPEELPLSDFFLKQISSQNPDSIKDYVKFSPVTFNKNVFTLAVQDPKYFTQSSGSLNHYLISTKGYVVDFNYTDAKEATKQILSTFKAL